jgi:hypothetical protein
MSLCCLLSPPRRPNFRSPVGGSSLIATGRGATERRPRTRSPRCRRPASPAASCQRPLLPATAAAPAPCLARARRHLARWFPVRCPVTRRPVSPPWLPLPAGLLKQRYYRTPKHFLLKSLTLTVDCCSISP